MNRTSSSFESQLRISTELPIAMMLASGVALFLASDWQPDPLARSRAHVFVLLLLAGAALAWGCHSWKPQAGRWAAVVTLAGLIHLADLWLGVPGTAALLVVPVAVAAAMIGLASATALAAAETALLLVPATAGGVRPLPAAEIVALWALLGVMYTQYARVHAVARWSWEYSERAQALLEQARDRKAQLEQALQDLAQANRQLALAHERTAVLRLAAEEAQRAKAEFVARVSHEFRTPLNMIIGLVGLMVEAPEVYAEELPPDLRRDLEIVHRNCQHLSGMINDVLDLSRMEVGRLTLHREPVPLAGIVESALAAVRPLIEKKGLSLRVAIADDLPPVYCDPTRIRQVLLNLASNAARFTAKGGLTVHVTERDGHAVMGVTDTGPGISAEHASRIFEPFYQAPGGSWRDGGGSGLGLSISKQCVELHGGRIWVESELGVGTTFYVGLPVAPPAGHPASAAQWIREDWAWREGAFRGAQAAATGELTRPRLVVCDRTGSLYPEFVRHSDEVEFVDTRDLAEATERLQQCPAHALVLNTAGSDDPWAVVEAARRRHPDTPIVACEVPPPALRSVQCGALGHLTKPVTRAGLEGAMRAVGKPVRRVLVVDDDPEVLQLMARTLRLYDAALEVAMASTGMQALAELREVPPDLVLLDIMLPQMSGWQVLERMGQDEGMRSIPVIVVSAQDPVKQQPTGKYLVATIGEGLSIRKLVRCSLEVSALLLRPD